MGKRYYTYITSNKYRTVLYTGMTSDLIARTVRHKSGVGSKFTSKYRAKDLVYYETHSRPQDAIAREKEIKGWRREKSWP